MNTVCFPSPWLIHGIALLSSLSPTPRFLSKGRKNQKNVDKRGSVYLCSFQCHKSPMTGQLNDCWKCSGDTARVVWHYWVRSAVPQSPPCDGEGSRGHEQSRQGSLQGLECQTALLQPEHLQAPWLGGSFHFGTLLNTRTRGPVNTGFAGPTSVLQWHQCDLKWH